MLSATCDVLGYLRHLHWTEHYEGPSEDLNPPEETAGGQIGFPQTPQMAADTFANI